MSTKLCIKCNEVKAVELFTPHKRNKDGRYSYCKVCRATMQREWANNNKDIKAQRDKEYAAKNKTLIASRKKEWQKKNEARLREKRKKYISDNKQHIATSKKHWVTNNKEYVQLWKKEYYERNKVKTFEYYRNRYHSDPQFALANKLRGRFRMAIKNKSKKGSAVRDLGMPIKAFLVYLNLDCLDKYGEPYTGNEKKYHIDHIRPLISFNLEDQNQVKIALNWQNLQVLTVGENMKKGSKHENSK